MFEPILVHDFLTYSANKFPDKIALICGNKKWTYQTLDLYSNQLALSLIEYGLKKHDRVIIFLNNSSETIISLYGILKAGGIFIILNSSIKTNKLKYIIQDSGAKILITHTSKSKIVNDALDENMNLEKIVWLGNASDIPKDLVARSILWKELFQDIHNGDNIKEKLQTNRRWRILDYDLATLIYTSGSTGEPKGVMSSHHNMVSAARSIIQYIQNISDDIILDVLPLSFDYGLYQVIMTFMFGGTIVLEKSFTYPIKILEIIEKEKVTGFPIVPTILAILLRMENLSKYNLSSLRYMTNTGAALPVEHIKMIRKILPHVKFISMYGLTECKRVSYLPPEELDHRPTSVGIPMPNCEVFIVDENGHEVPKGKIGELVVRGSNVMRGYWNAPEITRKTFRKGHFPGEVLLYTGDLFRMDEEGYLYFVGRKDDLIKTKGERVSPKEIENVLYMIPGVVEAAVIGVPDEVLGQAVKAFLVCDQDYNLTEKDILKYCSDNLETFMIPKYIKLVKELPKTPNGKIDKKALK